MSQSSYEQRALEAEAEAERAESAADREALLKMAKLWRELAQGVARLQSPDED